MFKHFEMSDDPTEYAVPAGPILTLTEAQVERAVRSQRYARDCILLAVVTSPRVSAELIDRAIECTRSATGFLEAGAPARSM
jgi:hypothetical protein